MKRIVSSYTVQIIMLWDIKHTLFTYNSKGIFYLYFSYQLQNNNRN